MCVLLFACGAPIAAGAQPKPTAGPAFSADIEPQAILHVMAAAADWRLSHESTHDAHDWTQAAFYTGVMSLSTISSDSKYLAAMRAMGERNGWRPGRRPGHADDRAVIATYARLHQIDKDARMLRPALALFDILAARRYEEPLTCGNAIETRELAWCDALFMGPPALAAVSATTGDRKYLDLASRLCWKTTEFLYDRSERLYFRDSRYFESREPNGKEVFWSRGNGWVLAGLARFLDDMPEAYPDRPRYLALFKEMAARIAELQGQDGYWRSSLLDPENLPNPETTGTAFYTFALAWGVNRGLPDRARFEPAVRRGWSALVRGSRGRHARVGAADRREAGRHQCGDNGGLWRRRVPPGGRRGVPPRGW